MIAKDNLIAASMSLIGERFEWQVRIGKFCRRTIRRTDCPCILIRKRRRTIAFPKTQTQGENQRMSKDGHSDKLRLGFIATVEVEGRGCVGGLLVTNCSGRPLEFQCTTPVRPDRTQEILYGKMLRPWLLGELIGKTLLDRVSIKPDIIVTGDPDLLELRNHTSTPVACTSEALSEIAAAMASSGSSGDLGGRRLRFHHSHPDDSSFVRQQLHQIPGQADLEEPLERVQQALNETVRTVMAR